MEMIMHFAFIAQPYRNTNNRQIITLMIAHTPQPIVSESALPTTSSPPYAQLPAEFSKVALGTLLDLIDELMPIAIEELALDTLQMWLVPMVAYQPRYQKLVT